MEGMDGSVDVVVDASVYGVTLENKTQGEEEVDLYPYLIYFDACSLSIRKSPTLNFVHVEKSACLISYMFVLFRGLVHVSITSVQWSTSRRTTSC